MQCTMQGTDTSWYSPSHPEGTHPGTTGYSGAHSVRIPSVYSMYLTQYTPMGGYWVAPDMHGGWDVIMMCDASNTYTNMCNASTTSVQCITLDAVCVRMC